MTLDTSSPSTNLYPSPPSQLIESSPLQVNKCAICLLSRRQDRETSAKDKNRAGNPSKESVPEPAPTQVSSVCPTKIDPVAVALHDYQPTSADDLAFQVTFRDLH